MSLGPVGSPLEPCRLSEVLQNPGQVCLNSSQVHWTAEVEDAIKSPGPLSIGFHVALRWLRGELLQPAQWAALGPRATGAGRHYEAPKVAETGLKALGELGLEAFPCFEA